MGNYMCIKYNTIKIKQPFLTLKHNKLTKLPAQIFNFTLLTSYANFATSKSVICT